MGEVYFIIVAFAVYLYMDRKDRKKRTIERRAAAPTISALVRSVIVVVKNRRLQLIRYYKMITYKEFDIPQIRFV